MSYKVLLVDDEASIRDMFSRLLQKENCAVKSASSGEEALNIIKDEDFDIVLLDIKLPGMDGLEVLKNIKSSRPDFIVIMLTALGYDEDLIAKAKEFGSSGYIGKNMPISQIMSNFRLFVKIAREKSRPINL